MNSKTLDSKMFVRHQFADYAKAALKRWHTEQAAQQSNHFCHKAEHADVTGETADIPGTC